MILIGPLWIICGVIAAIVAEKRGNGGCLWLFLGFLLGPFGVMMAFADGRQCPYCRERIHQRAVKCAKCQSVLPAPPPPVTPPQPIPQISPEQLARMTAQNKKAGYIIALAVVLFFGVLYLSHRVFDQPDQRVPTMHTVTVFRTPSGAPCTQKEWDRQYLHGLKPGEQACKIEEERYVR
jgi:hypothetical protein